MASIPEYVTNRYRENYYHDYCNTPPSDCVAKFEPYQFRNRMHAALMQYIPGEKVLAFASGSHRRLGAQSWIQMLDPDLIRMIGSFVGDDTFKCLPFRPNGDVPYSDLDGHVDLCPDEVAYVRGLISGRFNRVVESEEDLSDFHGRGGDAECLDGQYWDNPLERDRHWIDYTVRFELAYDNSTLYSIMYGDIHYLINEFVGCRPIVSVSTTRISICPLRRLVYPVLNQQRTMKIEMVEEEHDPIAFDFKASRAKRFLEIKTNRKKAHMGVFKRRHFRV